MSPAIRAASAAIRGATPHQWRLAAVTFLAWGVVFAFGVTAFPEAALGRRADPGPPMVSITAYPALEEAVRTYYRRYEEAQAACDIATFLKHYPALSEPGDPGTGINYEQSAIPSRCEYVRSIRFELERYEPMGVHVHPGGADVRVHGLEWWEYKRGDPGGGEFITTLSLREVAGTWTVVRSDEVTLAEYHEQH